MLKLPAADASDDEWHEFAEARSEDLRSNLREFTLERFTYKRNRPAKSSTQPRPFRSNAVPCRCSHCKASRGR